MLRLRHRDYIRSKKITGIYRDLKILNRDMIPHHGFYHDAVHPGN